MTLGQLITFGLLAVVAVFAAFRMLVSRHPVHSALYLVLNLICTAGIYLLLVAPFLAVVQVAVYGGAIMVLFLFIMMYINIGPARDLVDSRQRRVATWISALLLGALIWLGAFVGSRGSVIEPAEAPLYRVEDVGQLLLGPYALPFEVASLLLVVAMVGAVVIARPQLKAEAEGREDLS